MTRHLERYTSSIRRDTTRFFKNIKKKLEMTSNAKKNKNKLLFVAIFEKKHKTFSQRKLTIIDSSLNGQKLTINVPSFVI